MIFNSYWFINALNCFKCAANCRRSEEHTSELQSRSDLVCRLLLEKKKKIISTLLFQHDTTSARVSKAPHTRELTLVTTPRIDAPRRQCSLSALSRRRTQLGTCVCTSHSMF